MKKVACEHRFASFSLSKFSWLLKSIFVDNYPNHFSLSVLCIAKIVFFVDIFNLSSKFFLSYLLVWHEFVVLWDNRNLYETIERARGEKQNILNCYISIIEYYAAFMSPSNILFNVNLKIIWSPENSKQDTGNG